MKKNKFKLRFLWSIILICAMVCGMIVHAEETTYKMTFIDTTGTVIPSGKAVIIDVPQGKTIGEACEEQGKTFPALPPRTPAGKTATHWESKGEVITPEYVPEERLTIQAAHRHTETILNPERPATCTREGATATIGCSDPLCAGETVSGGAVIPKTAHQYADTANKENWEHDEMNHWQVCTECQGAATGTAVHVYSGDSKECDVCQYIKSEGTCEHKELEHMEHKDATCGLDGYQEYWQCKNCKRMFQDANASIEIASPIVIPATGIHENIVEITNTAVEPTCTTAGKYEDTTCRDCGEVFKGEPLAALGHDINEEAWQFDKSGHWHPCNRCTDKLEEKPHTPGEAATETKPQICTECGYEIQPAAGHTHVTSKVAAKPAACTEDGCKEYYTCTGCSKIFADATASIETTLEELRIEKLGHDLKEVAGSAVAASCTTAGKEADQKCTRCDYHVPGTTIPATGHTAEAEWKSDAAGHWHICSKCKEKMDAAVHNFGTKNICSVCQYTKAEEPCEHHNIIVISDTAIEPTCTNAGKYEDTKCNDCGEVFKGDAREPLGHDIVKDTWKSDQSGHWHICNRCQEKIDAAAHTFGEENVCSVCRYQADHKHILKLVEAVPASCTADGCEAYYECSSCKEIFKDQDANSQASKEELRIEKLGHDLKEAADTYQAPTCTQAGKAADQICSRCGYIEAGGVIAANGHKASTVWTADQEGHWHACEICSEKLDVAAHTPGPEATEDQAQVCTVCHYELAPAVIHQHDLKLVEAVEPGHTTSGNKAYYKCSSCSQLFADANAENPITLADVTLEATGEHTYGDWIITKEPTTAEEGIKERICSECGNTETASIPKIIETTPGNDDEENDDKVKDEPQKEEPDTQIKTDNNTSDPTASTKPAAQPSPEKGTVSPQTGDTADFVMWLLLLIVCTAGVVFSLSGKRIEE